MKQEKIGNAGQDARIRNGLGVVGCFYHPHRPFLWILLKNISGKDKAEPASDVLKRSAQEWYSQFFIIH